MSGYSPALQKANLRSIEPDVHGLISKRTAELDGVSVTEVTFGVGARWSQDLKEYAGTDSCLLPHVSLVVGGTLRVVSDDGTQEDFSAGDVMLLPPGHDAWPGRWATSRPSSSSSPAETTTTRTDPGSSADRCPRVAAWDR